jgi:hypothetical protein
MALTKCTESRADIQEETLWAIAKSRRRAIRVGVHFLAPLRNGHSTGIILLGNFPLPTFARFGKRRGIALVLDRLTPAATFETRSEGVGK